MPFKVDDANSKGSFRSEGGDILATSANAEEAKSLLKKAGVTKGSFTITTRDNETDVAVAEAAAEAWKALGFTVKVEKLGAKELPNKVANQSVVYEDLYTSAYKAGDFDVILVDYNALAPNAFSILAPFSADYSGNGTDMYSENYDKIAHVTGYSSKDYDALIEKAYTAESSEDELKALHEAEELLLKDMPVIPVVFQQDAFLSSKDVSGIKSTYFGRDFKKMKMKNYMEFKESIQADLNEDEAEAKN